MPDVDDDEDLLDDLPPLGNLDDDEPLGDEALAPEALGLETLEGDESVGLDDSAGLEDADALFQLELPPEDAAGDEATTDLDAIPVEGLGDAEEYGWTQQSGASDEPLDPDTVDLGDLTPLGRDDGGEEGVDDDFDFAGLDGDRLPHLPPLQADAEDDDEPLDDPSLLGLTLPRRGPELPGAYEPSACVAVRLTPAIPIRSALVTAEVTWAVGDALFAIRGDAVDRARADGLEERRALSAAVGDDGHRLVVGTDRGIARSVDQGRSFKLLGAMASASFEVLREPDTDRVWAYSDAGALHRSDDLGATWSGPLLLKPVAGLSAGPGGVVALCAPRVAPAQLARTIDGGQRWAAVDVPELDTGSEDAPAALSLSARGDLVALSSDASERGPLLSKDAGRGWVRIPGLPTAHALAITRERGGVTLYAAHRLPSGGTAVLRHRPDGDDGGTVLELPDEAARVSQIVVEAVDDRVSRLHVATSVGLYRVTLTLDALSAGRV